MEVDSVDTAAIQRWRFLAESLVREGITSKHPDLVATILAEREAGTPPSTIARHYRVHRTTVGRTLTAADALSALWRKAEDIEHMPQEVVVGPPMWNIVDRHFK